MDFANRHMLHHAHLGSAYMLLVPDVGEADERVATHDTIENQLCSLVVQMDRSNWRASIVGSISASTEERAFDSSVG
eukprot:7210369-Prymnesium_polylepis.3